jgi:hypothetical protein
MSMSTAVVLPLRLGFVAPPYPRSGSGRFASSCRAVAGAGGGPPRPITVAGDPPTVVSAPGRRIVASTYVTSSAPPPPPPPTIQPIPNTGYPCVRCTVRAVWIKAAIRVQLAMSTAISPRREPRWCWPASWARNQTAMCGQAGAR